jgi:hypothetical protein
MEHLLNCLRLTIEFTIGADSIAKKLGEAVTDSKGVAIFTCKRIS